MPRDSNGDYSLPAGNPVVTGTVISSNWANTTLDDIATALTNSLDRAGAGGMTGQLKLSNGLIGAPALTWTTEPTSGLYRNAAGDFRYSIASNDVSQWVAGAFRVVNGVVGTPSLSFISDPDTGMYLGAANEVDFAAGGALRFSIGSTVILSGTTHRFQDGVVATPSITFDSDLDTGFYRIGANVLGIAVGGAAVAHATATSFNVDVVQLNEDGNAAGPGYSFENDPDTGMYRVGANQVGLSAGGLGNLLVSDTRIQSTVVHWFANGAVGTPSISFTNDNNTGLYSIGADDLGFTTGGNLRAEINSAGTFLYGGREIGYRSLNPNTQNAGYTLVADDRGREVAAGTSGNFTINNGVFAAGDIITFVNTTGANCTLVQGAGVTFRLMGATGTTGNRTVADYGVATIIAQTAAVFLVGGPGVS